MVVTVWAWQASLGWPDNRIEETSDHDRQDSARKASEKRRKETREGRKGDGA